MYEDKWDPVAGEILECKRKPTNVHDRYAVAVKKDGTTIGHLSQKNILSMFAILAKTEHYSLYSDWKEMALY